MSKEATLKLALEALENNRRTHYYCEDTWYSCPKHEEGCANESEGDECNCGADKANVEIDGAIIALREALAQQALDKKAENARELGLDYEPARDSGIVTAGGADPRTQRTWVGLTNNELQPIADEYRILFGSWVEDFARAIEAKLKEQHMTPNTIQFHSDNHTEVLHLSKDGIWANPDIPVDEAAKLVLAAMEWNIKVLVDKAVADERERIYFQTSSDFVKAAIAIEREACAKVVEASPSYDWHKFACEAAAAIRNRSNT